MARPTFLLAFAYNPAQALPEVVTELKTIERLLSETEGSVSVVWQVTQADLETHFDQYRDELRLFHFSGHAGPKALQLNRDNQSPQISFADGLAGLAGMAKGLRLVFLNGCSTEDQAKVFISQGIPAVIATTKPLLDRYAVDFARRFYQSFTRRNSKMTLQQAFEAAFYSFISENGSLSRDMLDESLHRSIAIDEDANEPLYELHLHPGKKNVADERFADWFSTETAGTNDALKKEIRDLIGKGNLEAALEKMTDLTQEAVELKGQLSAVNKDKRLNLIGFNELTIARNRIMNGALELLRNL